MTENLTFYKLRDFSPLHIELPTRRELFFAAPHTLNDPLDCCISVRESLNALIEREKVKEVRDVWQQLLSINVFSKVLNKDVNFHDSISAFTAKSGVLSLTQAITDTLVWSHYGNGHRGVAYGFTEAFFEDLANNYDHTGIMGVSAVVYQDAPPHEEIFRERAKQVLSSRRGITDPYDNRDAVSNLFEEAYRAEMLTKTLTTKYTPWAYEREYRAVRYEPGLTAFPPSALIEVVFGLKATRVDRDQVHQALRHEDFKHVRFREAHTLPNSFELQIRDL